MKRTNFIYQIATILFAGLTLLSGMMTVSTNASTIELMHQQLRFPIYIIPFIAVAKMLGAVVLLIPGFPRLKEWAYAGLMIDLRIYSISCIDFSERVSMQYNRTTLYRNRTVGLVEFL